MKYFKNNYENKTANYLDHIHILMNLNSLQQQSNKKKKNKDNMRQAPFSITDGDTIGVKVGWWTEFVHI